MNVHAQPLTLIEDWRQRRQSLLDDSGSIPQLAATLRILDYLIERYICDERARQPARFPLSNAAKINERRILVFHHLRRTGIHDSRSAVEAERQVKWILERMQAETCEAPDDNEPLAPVTRASRRSYGYWSRILRKQWFGWNVDRDIRVMLRKRPYLPPKILQHLQRRRLRCSRIESSIFPPPSTLRRWSAGVISQKSPL